MSARFIALTRAVSPRLAECELTHQTREPINVGTAHAQHHQYEELLTSLGCEVRRVAPAPELADSVFIEDTAIVFDDVAIITRPGALSRRAEVAAVERALTPLRPLVRIVSPAILDGGDVFHVGRRVFVGLTSRTNEAGIMQLRADLAPFGYSVHQVAVTGCLHLKSAATALDDTTVLVNPAWVDVRAFAPLACVVVHPEEPGAANVLRLGDVLVYADAYPHTLERLRERGFCVHTVPATEIAKAEGAVTCCSLVMRA